jgi:hypothetical protein
MTADVTIIRYLGPIIADVASGRRRPDDVMACIQRWASDMACREMVAIRTNDGSGEAMIRAIRARGMYLAVLSLGVRLEHLQTGQQVDHPVG